MASPKLGILGQAKPAAGITSLAYKVPVSEAPDLPRRAVCSTVVAAAKGATTSIRVHAVKVGASPDDTNQLCWDTLLPANSSYNFTMGVTLAEGEGLYVRSESGDVVFTLFGEESDVPA